MGRRRTPNNSHRLEAWSAAPSNSSLAITMHVTVFPAAQRQVLPDESSPAPPHAPELALALTPSTRSRSLCCRCDKLERPFSLACSCHARRAPLKRRATPSRSPDTPSTRSPPPTARHAVRRRDLVRIHTTRATRHPLTQVARLAGTSSTTSTVPSRSSPSFPSPTLVAVPRCPRLTAARCAKQDRDAELLPERVQLDGLVFEAELPVGQQPLCDRQGARRCVFFFPLYGLSGGALLVVPGAAIVYGE